MNNAAFQCFACGAHFDGKLFDIAREYIRVIYNSPPQLHERDVHSADAIGEFCSSECRERGRSAVLARDGVSIPAMRPGIEPIEICARCSGPVDMSDWHVLITESDLDESFRTLDSKYLAVFCATCEPQRFGSAAARLTP